ncbi:MULTISPECIES: hypothetical protein [unclassified Lysinibacillus]|uniref:hypothetical protein n=1 Tax=unclassified Lysinibacillus TaxID=2636778 RepID=UPI0035E2D79F
MPLLLNTLIESGNGNSKEQIEAELNEWLLAKGYTVSQNHSFALGAATLPNSSRKKYNRFS